MASRSESEDDEARAQSDDEECSDDGRDGDLGNGREDEPLADVVDAGPHHSSEEVVNSACSRGAHRGRRGNPHGGNKRGKKKNRGGGNRGRGNYSNVCSSNAKNSKVENGNESSDGNFNMNSEFFKYTDENENVVSNNSNSKGLKSRDEVHQLEGKCLIEQGQNHHPKKEVLGKGSPPVNNWLFFGNNGNKKTQGLVQNGENNKPGNNNKDKNNNGNKGCNDNNNGNNKNNNTNNTNTSNKGGAGGGDLKWDALSRHLKHLCYSLGMLKRNSGPGYTLESQCLICHYRFLVLFFCISYFVVTLNWYVNEQIICYKMGASDKPVTGPYRDICLSYPFVEPAQESRRYLLFYRWVPYSFLLAAAAVYTLRAGPVKKWENFRLAQLYKDIWMERSSYETSRWTTVNRRVVQFIMTRQAESLHYYKWILCHIFANLVVTAAVFYFNFVLQGAFVTLVPDVMYALHRDPMFFKDPLSTIFPPFAECQISTFHKVLDNNEFNFGCHLTLMELYEKLFFVTWSVLALHWFWSSMMTLWLTFGLVPFFGKFSCIVTGHVKYKESAINMWKTVRKCTLGEVHVLYLVKRWMSCAQFDQLLAALLEEKENERMEQGSNSGDENHNRYSKYVAVPIES